MWNARIKLACLVLAFSPSTFALIQFGSQFLVERQTRDALAPHLILESSQVQPLVWSFGSIAHLSQKDLESFSYRGQLEWNCFPFLGFGTRLNQRVHFSETLSRTTLTAWLQIKMEILQSLRFHFLGGWYHRWVGLRRMSLIPYSSTLEHSQSDFVTQLGIEARLSSQWSHLLQVATLDEWDTFNLNNPFVESRTTFRNLESESYWVASLRYQLLLGFGHLDRLILGLAYGAQW